MTQPDRLTVRATRSDPHSTLITVGGAVDLATAPMLSTALRAMVVIGGGRTVVDLNAVSFLGACGVEALSVARKHAATTGTTLSTAAGPQTAARRVLAILQWVHDPVSATATGTARASNSPRAVGHRCGSCEPALRE